ncbi:hypothetical protein [Rhizobium leguminosarum]
MAIEELIDLQAARVLGLAGHDNSYLIDYTVPKATARLTACL